MTKSILDANGGLVDYLAGQSFNDHGDPQTFDWTVAYEAGKLSANYSPARQLKVITSQLAMREKMSEDQRMFIRRLQAQKFAEVLYVQDDVVTGGNIGEEQVEVARLALGIQDGSPHHRSQNGIHYWTTVVDKQGGPFSCAVASLRAGNVNAASITTQLLSELKPKKVLMIGIAAGLRGKMKLGDVVIAERVVYYEGTAALPNDVLAPRPEMQRPGLSTQQDLSTYLSVMSLSERRQERTLALNFVIPTESKAGDVAARVMVAPATIASGEKLIRDPVLFASFRSQHDKACVAEMEAYGVVDTCDKQNVPALVIRGISDFGDSLKDDLFHDVASKAAAIVSIDYPTHGWSRG